MRIDIEPPADPLRRALRAIRNLVRPGLPRHLSRRMRRLDDAGLARVRSALAEHLGTGPADAERQDDDFLNHLHRRLDADRAHIIPWLDAARPLADSNVLEIGCGTGSSTVALAEQGARVTAIDVDPPSTAVAVARCRIHAVEARIEVANATEVRQRYGGQAFDFIIFYASLEHMLYGERLEAMQATWRMLSPGGLWCVIEAPNRLWYRDHHTAQLDFFQWLPDELAVLYAGHSPRGDVRAALEGREAGDEQARQKLLRMGRGVSFHEFDLAIKPAGELDVVSNLAAFERRRDKALWLRWRASFDYRYQSLLIRLRPDLDPGFFEANLDLIIRKNTAGNRT
ncbi:MAG: methyltransferase domain-containing protein [Pirellulales bacterium]